jgi:hypothetical protein
MLIVMRWEIPELSQIHVSFTKNMIHKWMYFLKTKGKNTKKSEIEHDDNLWTSRGKRICDCF